MKEKKKVIFLLVQILKTSVFKNPDYLTKLGYGKSHFVMNTILFFISFEGERTERVPWNLHNLCFIVEKMQTTGLNKYRNNIDFNRKIISPNKIIKQKPENPDFILKSLFKVSCD